MEKLCLHYGPQVGTVELTPLHDMPLPSALTSAGVEAHLRQLGFGYRAKYLHQTALMIVEEYGEEWLNGLRNPESPVLGQPSSDAGGMLPEGRPGYREAHDALLGLQGVGPKVADCVCLMGLGWGEAVPVDTHGTAPLNVHCSCLLTPMFQYGKLRSEITDSAKASTAVSREQLTMPWGINSEVYGEKKLVGPTASSSQLIFALSPRGFPLRQRRRRSRRKRSRLFRQRQKSMPAC